MQYRTCVLAVIGALLVLTELVSAQQATRRAENPAFAKITDDPSLPRVLLIGDSISIGYTLPTREMLASKANVHRISTNGGPTTNGVANLDKWLGDGKWDVIHFNFGLHDLKQDADGKRQVPVDQYEKHLRQIVAGLKKSGARLIWASTTPVPEGELNPVRSDSDVKQYNEAARRVMEEHDVEINDLYAFARPRLKELQRPINVHFTDDGSRVLAQQVSASISKALEKK
jgi:acyl-CoA thioesterase-1